jgi:hypothetical protein
VRCELGEACGFVMVTATHHVLKMCAAARTVRRRWRSPPRHEGTIRAARRTEILLSQSSVRLGDLTSAGTVTGAGTIRQKRNLPRSEIVRCSGGYRPLSSPNWGRREKTSSFSSYGVVLLCLRTGVHNPSLSATLNYFRETETCNQHLTVHPFWRTIALRQVLRGKGGGAGEQVSAAHYPRAPVCATLNFAAISRRHPNNPMELIRPFRNLKQLETC